MKKALVTGASRGIGAATARELARAGFEVIVNYKNSRDAAEQIASEIGGIAVRADVSDMDDVKRMVDSVGGVDALVCNAGIALTGLFQDTAPRWREVFDTNLGGAISCIEAALPHMINQKRGRIVIVSSVWGVTGASCEAIYSASKAALIGLTKSLANELGLSGITVNCVAPGVINTDMNDNLTASDLSALAEQTPLGRLGTPQDVANAIAWLCSDSATFVTGQVLGVDGGFVG